MLGSILDGCSDKNEKVCSREKHGVTLRSNWREKELFRIGEEKEGGIIKIETNSPMNFNPTQLRCTLCSLFSISLEYQLEKECGNSYLRSLRDLPLG